MHNDYAAEHPLEYADWRDERDSEETTLGFTAWLQQNHPDKVVTETVVLCGVVIASCRCGLPEGHVEQGEETHVCVDQEVCKDQWTGETNETFVPVVYPGGYTEVSETFDGVAAMLLRILQ